MASSAQILLYHPESRSEVMLKKMLMIAMMASVAGAALAADKKQSWPQEPESFMGISLSKSVAESMPQCPSKSTGELVLYQTSLCHSEPYSGYVSIYGGPKIGIHYSLGAMTRDDKIKNISLNTKEYEFDKLLQMLTEKYGKPTSKDLESVQTNGGVKLTNETYYWIGKKVMIRLDRYSGDIESSSAMIFNKEVLEAAAKDSDRAVSAGASKF
jgi:hypothetical protein